MHDSNMKTIIWRRNFISITHKKLSFIIALYLQRLQVEGCYLALDILIKGLVFQSAVIAAK